MPTDSTLTLELDEVYSTLSDTPVAIKARKVASGFFSHWCGKVRNVYPRFNSMIMAGGLSGLSADELAGDLINSFARAIHELLAGSGRDETVKEAPGFVKGFVATDLCTEWYGRFIFPETEEYSGIMALKAVLACMDRDPEMENRVAEVHRALLGDDSSRDAQILEEPGNLIRMSDFRVNAKEEETERSRAFIRKYLDSLLRSEISRAWLDSCRGELPIVSLNDYYTDQEVSLALDLFRR